MPSREWPAGKCGRGAANQQRDFSRGEFFQQVTVTFHKFEAPALPPLRFGFGRADTHPEIVGGLNP